MESDQDPNPTAKAAVLEHLTGRCRGTVTWIEAPDCEISLEPERLVRLSEYRTGELSDKTIGRIRRVDDTYEIVARDGQPIWVNGLPVTAKRLKHRDMIEFGERGPLARFCIHSEEEQSRKTVGQILADSVAYMRVSRQPRTKRFCYAVAGLLRRLTRETTILFRTVVLIAIVGLATWTYQQSRLTQQLQQDVASGAAKLDSFAAALTRAREEALTNRDLLDLREELGQRLSSNKERLEALEQRSQASARVIAESMSAVAFLQGSYGFRERATGRMLRYVVGEDERPLLSPLGLPLLTLDGDGPVAERQFTGTAFVVGRPGALVTNRHVALPWEKDASAEMLSGEDLEPEMTKLVAYLPGRADAMAVELLRASDEVDLAILQRIDVTEEIASLTLADAPPTAGDEVIVMGYPTGLRAMLAQSGDAFIEMLQEQGDTDFWSVAAHLAELGHIAPLASRGIVAQTTLSTVVYDADTTHGGSGGPVLDVNGAVVAVNSAIMPEYGGSNIGIPAAEVRRLLVGIGTQ
jgi:S1-C subfamily serine protease